MDRHTVEDRYLSDPWFASELEWPSLFGTDYATFRSLTREEALAAIRDCGAKWIGTKEALVWAPLEERVPATNVSASYGRLYTACRHGLLGSSKRPWPDVDDCAATVIGRNCWGISLDDFRERATEGDLPTAGDAKGGPVRKGPRRAAVGSDEPKGELCHLVLVPGSDSSGADAEICGLFRSEAEANECARHFNRELEQAGELRRAKVHELRLRDKLEPRSEAMRATEALRPTPA